MTNDWIPQPAQTLFLERREFEAGYGGAKGGGKTDALLFGALRQIHIPGYRAVIFRRTYPQLRELIDRSQYFRNLVDRNGESYEAVYAGDKHRWTFKSGAILDFGHCQHEEDKQDYQGQEYHYMGFDQLEQFTETQYTFLIANIRTANPNIKLYVRSSFNPGGVGHLWVKKRFIDNKEPYKTYTVDYDVKKPDGTMLKVNYDSVFIPAKVWDNKILLENNPNYLASLMQLDDKARKALLEGNWDVFEGQYFTEWDRNKHTCSPFAIPDGWRKFRAYDHGRQAPACCLWFALDYDGRLWCYRELYQSNQDVDQLAAEIKRLSEGEEYQYSVADPSIFNKLGFVDRYGGQTIAESFARQGVMFIPASNKRIAGWSVMHQYLRWDEFNSPKLMFFDTCYNAVRTLPALIHDSHKLEDLDSSGEDHVADAVRYILLTLHESHTEKSMTDVERKLQDIKRYGDKLDLNSFYMGDDYRDSFGVEEN